MALAPYIFGAGTNIRTPQEAAHLRAVAEALASQGHTPHTIGEGLSAIGDAIASRRYRMRGDRMESEGRAAYQSKYGDLVKTLLSGGGGTAAPVPPQPDLSQARPEYLTGGGMPPPPTMENVANAQLPPLESDASISSYSPPNDPAAAAGQPVQTAGLSITGSDLPQAEPRQPGVTQVAAGGGFDPRMIDALNDPWAPEGTKAVLGAMLEQRMKEMGPRDPIKVGEHDTLLDPITHKVIYGGQNAGVADAPKITAITALRKDYENQPGTSRYRQSVPVLQSMASAVDDTAKMADLDFVYGMAQIFDPNSVVRESEMGMVIDSQSMPAAIKGRLEKILNGKAELGPQARRDLVEASRRRVQQYRTQAEGEQEQYGGIADRNHINRQDILRPLEAMPEVAAAPPPDTTEDTSQFQEGDLIEDDQGRQFRIVNGKPVPVL